MVTTCGVSVGMEAAGSWVRAGRGHHRGSPGRLGSPSAISPTPAAEGAGAGHGHHSWDESLAAGFRNRSSHPAPCGCARVISRLRGSLSPSVKWAEQHQLPQGLVWKMKRIERRKVLKTTLGTVAKRWTQPVATSRWMDKEGVVRPHPGSVPP